MKICDICGEKQKIITDVDYETDGNGERTGKRIESKYFECPCCKKKSPIGIFIFIDDFMYVNEG